MKIAFRLTLLWLDLEVRKHPGRFGRRVKAEHLSHKFLLSIAQQKPKGIYNGLKLQSFLP